MNQGTHPHPDSPVAPHFDWYAATIDDSPAEVERHLAIALGADPIAATPLHGYEHARQFRDADGLVVATLLYGGGGNGLPHAFASGADAVPFSAAVRALWPKTLSPGASGGHYVTRLDSAIDYDDPAAWAKLTRAAIALAEQKGLRLGTAGDWITADAERIHGRTLYVGSASSDVQVRIYEKGLQLRESLADPLDVAATSPHWVRLEVRVRPQKDARHRAATSSPLEAYGYARWTQDLLRDLEGLDVERVAIHETRETDDERALTHMVRQYGKTLARLAAAAGGWPALGLDLERRAVELGINTQPTL